MFFALEQVQLTTRRCCVEANTLQFAWHTLRHMWSNELTRGQRHKFVCGAPIVRPLYVIGASLANIIHRPLDAKTRKDQWRMFRRESIACGRVLACEAARAGRHIITHVASSLDAAADRLDSCDMRNVAHASPRSNPSDLSDVRTLVKDVRSAFLSGFDGAWQACVGAITSCSPYKLAKAAPVAILRPAAGASRGVALILIGIEEASTTRRRKPTGIHDVTPQAF